MIVPNLGTIAENSDVGKKFFSVFFDLNWLLASGEDGSKWDFANQRQWKTLPTWGLVNSSGLTRTG
jgi:hypothetical protein